jgi:hypothetical protein
MKRIYTWLRIGCVGKNECVSSSISVQLQGFGSQISYAITGFDE